eukprot:CAMPEP_0174331108 /NCGR_PEP_ID=MMETSP0810-20121108/17223_1 /TAXON_ID=73025 ORGANISM="Eutreptiella gymnastica-like, Strain CCMP1594" /NCGR_SAMPLE_ID=MMETSP0810 /ASSEMBLY_ACC=CAM_ASM_000659 /LENGTH=32 /DNA_ID= /DNA_START= /DNA_END= /DNA_ORIENTATION=
MTLDKDMNNRGRGEGVSLYADIGIRGVPVPGA